jgi:hypothetical protein
VLEGRPLRLARRGSVLGATLAAEETHGVQG